MALCVTYGMSLDVCMVPGLSLSLMPTYVCVCVCVKAGRKNRVIVI